MSYEETQMVELIQYLDKYLHNSCSCKIFIACVTVFRTNHPMFRLPGYVPYSVRFMAGVVFVVSSARGHGGLLARPPQKRLYGHRTTFH